MSCMCRWAFLFDKVLVICKRGNIIRVSLSLHGILIIYVVLVIIYMVFIIIYTINIV